MTLNEVRKLCDEKAHVPLWPDAGTALGLGRWSSYEQAKQGKIETIGIGRRKRVPTSWLRKKLGIERPMTDEGDEPGPGMAVRISGNDVSRVGPANAACTGSGSCPACGWQQENGRRHGQWVPMSDEELKKYLAGLTSDMLDLADKSDLWRAR